ncbi:hypothetical protein ACJX0J_015990 [Zea mays]
MQGHIFRISIGHLPSDNWGGLPSAHEILFSAVGNTYELNNRDAYGLPVASGSFCLLSHFMISPRRNIFPLSTRLLALYLFGDIGIGYSTGNGLSLFYIYMIAATLEIILQMLYKESDRSKSMFLHLFSSC